MKKSLLTLVFTIISFSAFSQTFEDVLYLKNGDTLRGLIIEQVPNKSLKIKVADNVLSYDIDAVEKITKEGKLKKFSTGLKKGYRGIVELNTCPRLNESSEHKMELNIINGYQINPHFSFGIGTGFHIYIRDWTAKYYTIPIFLDFRVHFINKPVSPFVGIKIGGSLLISNSQSFLNYINGYNYYYDGYNYNIIEEKDWKLTNGGFLISPSLGVMIKTSEKTALSFSTAFGFQKILHGVSNNGKRLSDDNLNLNINIGIIF